MYQLVLTNNIADVEKVKCFLINELNSIADKVGDNYKFGTEYTINRIKFLKIKKLLPIITNSCDANLKLINRIIDIVKC